MLSATLYVIPVLIGATFYLALIKKTNAFDLFLVGVKEGMALFKEIFPSLLAMLAAVKLLQASGFVEDFGHLLGRLIPQGQFIATMTPMMLFRPLSGSASLAILSSLCSTHGPDSLPCRTAAILEGSTDTTFYVITLYFGTINITKWRHSIAAGLTADIVGMIMALLLGSLFFG